jgi:hypothetical protein
LSLCISDCDLLRFPLLVVVGGQRNILQCCDRSRLLYRTHHDELGDNYEEPVDLSYVQCTGHSMIITVPASGVQARWQSGQKHYLRHRSRVQIILPMHLPYVVVLIYRT